MLDFNRRTIAKLAMNCLYGKLGTPPPSPRRILVSADVLKNVTMILNVETLEVSVKNNPRYGG